MNGPIIHNSGAQAYIAKAIAIPVENDPVPVEIESEVSPLKIAYLIGSGPLEKRTNRYTKRIVDIIISCFLIVTVFPWLIPLLGVMIKLDSRGPVFFFQKRNKLNGKVFTCIKFRTMRLNKEADFQPASEDDGRITRIGKFLREHHLDELPQLFNVLKGDMSVIGPRPHMISDNIRFTEIVSDYHHRHKVKPGITGLAQVLGFVGPVNDNEDIRERIEKDIYYVCNWSIALDMKIVFRTFFTMLGFKRYSY